MSLSVVPDHDSIYVALIAYLTALLPEGVPVIRGLPNRVAAPPYVPGFVVIQALSTERLRMAIDTYPQGVSEAPTNYTIEQGIEVGFQIDVYSKHAGSWAALISTTFQDTYGVNALAPNCVPLYCNTGRMIPLTDSEEEYEQRWSLDARLQWNPVVTAPQQYADQLELTLKDVNVEFPT
jgi:hypothetical protein